MLSSNKSFKLSKWKTIKVIKAGTTRIYEIDEKENLKERFRKSKPRNLQEEILKLMKTNESDNIISLDITLQPQGNIQPQIQTESFNNLSTTDPSLLNFNQNISSNNNFEYNNNNQEEGEINLFEDYNVDDTFSSFEVLEENEYFNDQSIDHFFDPMDHLNSMF